MPVVAMPQGSFAPAMLATPGTGPAASSVIPVPHSQSGGQQSGVPNQASPPPAYVSNPDLQQPQGANDGANTTTAQEKANWEKF